MVDTKDERGACDTHYEVGSEVRNSIKKLGSTMSENLNKPSKSLKEIKKNNKENNIKNK